MRRWLLSGAFLRSLYMLMSIEGARTVTRALHDPEPSISGLSYHRTRRDYSGGLPTDTMLCYVTRPDAVVMEVEVDAKANGEDCLTQVRTFIGC